MFDSADDRWRDDAACKGKPLAWFVPDNESARSTAKAKEVCAACPVRQECAEWAMDFDIFPLVGVFGGMTTVERVLAVRDGTYQAEAS
jgi:WhiB family redox-sensing transcriptional regulator